MPFLFCLTVCYQITLKLHNHNKITRKQAPNKKNIPNSRIIKIQKKSHLNLQSDIPRFSTCYLSMKLTHHPEAIKVIHFCQFPFRHFITTSRLQLTQLKEAIKYNSLTFPFTPPRCKHTINFLTVAASAATCNQPKKPILEHYFPFRWHWQTFSFFAVIDLQKPFSSR